MYDVNSTLKEFEKQLCECGIENAKNELRFLCAELLNKKTADLLITKSFTKKEYCLLKNAVKKRKKHVSLQIIIGKSNFLNAVILENKHTLTPRPETELLTSIIINEHKGKIINVLDLCCGSGCIAIALNLAGHKTTALDISKKAIKCARKNAKINKAKVKFINSDLFNNVKQKYDVIVSNPPYVRSAEIAELSPEVKNFDPLIALDGGIDGFDFYGRIANDAYNFLKENGVLYLEFGKGQAQSIKKLLSKNFKNIKIIKDFNNIDRFIKAELK